MFNNSSASSSKKYNLKFNRLALPFVLVALLLLTTIPAIISYQKGQALYLTMSIRTSAPGEAALYYDSGSGFREDDKAVTQIRQDHSAIVYAFSIPNQDLLRFRFDPPVTFEQTISIGNIRIVDATGKTLQKIDPNLLKPLHQIRTFQHDGSETILTIQDGADDPQVSINLDSPFRPVWSALKDGLFLGLIAGETLLIILIYFLISYLWPRWRVHPRRKVILVTFLLLYAGGLWVIWEKTTTAYLKVNMQSSFSGVAQLFYDTGRGYSEFSSARINITGSSDFSDYLFRLPSNKIYQFRFDPPSSANSFVIRRMEVISGLGVSIQFLALNQVHPGYQIHEHKLLDQGLRIVTEEPAEDPQLIINLKKPLHINKIDLLLNPVHSVCVLSLFPIALLLAVGLERGTRKGNLYKFYYLPSTKHKYILFAVCIIISLVILSVVHRQSFSDTLRYTRIAEGNISHYVYGMWTSGMSGWTGLIRGDAQIWGRIRPAHWLFYNIPFALTLARNGDLLRQDAMVPISKRINGDLQTHTLFLILCMAVACGSLTWLVWYLARSWLAFLLLPLYFGMSYTICENLLVNYADSQEIPQLLWISFYLVSISKIFRGQRPSVVCEVFAALFLLLAYATKETSLVMLPICSCIFGLLFFYYPKEQKEFRFFCLRQIGWQVVFSVILVAFVWFFRSGAYTVPNYALEWQNLLSSYRHSLRIFDLGVSWMNLLLVITVPLCFSLIRRIILKQFIVGTQDGLFLLLIIAVSLCYGFWMIYMPWKHQLAKYYLPAVFWGSFAVVILQIYLANQLIKHGYRKVCSLWLIVSCWYMLTDFNRLNDNIKYFYESQYGYRRSVPIIAKDIVASMKKQSREVYRVHIVGTKLFQEGALPFQRQVNLLYGMNIAVKGQTVRHVNSGERNYFRNYSRQPAAEISLSQSLPDQSGEDVIYICQVPGGKESSGIILDGFHVSRQWDDVHYGVSILKYDRI